MNDSPWRRRQAAADYLGCTAYTIDRYKRRGILKPKFLGRIPIYHTTDLNRLLTARLTLRPPNEAARD